MSDALEHEVKIIIDVVSNLQKAAREIDAASESLGGLPRDAQRAADSIHGVVDALTGVANRARGTKDALKVDSATINSWKALRKQMQDAVPADAGGRNYRNASTSMDDIIATQGGVGKDFAAQLRAQMQEREKAFQQQAQAAVKAGQEEQRQLDLIGASHAKNASTRRAAAESDRQAQWTSIQNAKAQASEEARVTAELQRQADARRNADRASAYATPRTGSFLGQGQTAGLSAADTTWARESEIRMTAARQALADYDKQLNSNTASYKANSSALATMLREEEAAEAALPRLRYALYDVATTAGITATAIAGVGAAVATAFASRESAFTNVERTLSPEEFLNADAFRSEIQEIRSELESLSLEIPKSFQDLSMIATLGNQLEVPKEALVDFTETIAAFSTITDVSVDEAAKAFGALQHTMDVPVEEFSNLASSIVLVGRSSAATESEILSLVRELSRQASGAGFAAQEVVALAGALGTLRIPPERARGSLTTYFETLNMAVAEGGEKLQKFASLVGLAPEALSQMVESGQGVEVLQRFLANLGDTSVEVSRNLSDLGLAQLRISDTFRGLSANAYLFNDYLQTSAQGYTENTELMRQMSLIADDLASKWQIFLSALGMVADAVGNQMAPAFGTALDVATSLLSAFAQFAASDFGGAVVRIVATIGAVVAGLAAIVAPIALAGASFAAFKTAIGAIPWAAISTRLFGIRDAGFAAAAGMRTTAGATAVATAALKAFMRATVILAVLSALSELVFNFGGSMIWIGDVLYNVGGALSAAANAFGGFASTIVSVVSALIPPLQGLASVLQAFGVGNVGDTLQSWGSSLRDFGKSIGNADTSLGDFGTSADSLDFGDWANGAGDFASGLDDVGGAAAGAAAEVRTLVDYAGDLSSVMQRAFDIRFGGQQGMDAITSGWQSIRDAADEAREAAEKHRRTLASMGADRSIKQYWLSVAENYGDELRAAKIRAELAELDADMATEKKGLNEAQDQASMSLNGNSAAAIANRAALLGLVGDYQSYLTALAASGASQATLEAEAQRLRGEFIRQATQMGFNRNEVERYARAFDDMILVIDRIPRNITVTANVNPALQALAEFEAAARRAGQNAGAGIGNGIGAGVNHAADRLRALEQMLNAAHGVISIINSIGLGRGASRGGSFWGSAGGGGFSGGRKEGGYTGNFGVNQVVGFHHGQEYVMSAPAVRNAGGPRAMDYMHQMFKAGKSPAPVGIGAAAGGPGLVDLSAGSIQALSASLAANLQVVLPGAQLAGSVGAHNVVSARRGAA